MLVSRGFGGPNTELASPDTGGAKDALDRITIPQEALRSFPRLHVHPAEWTRRSTVLRMSLRPSAPSKTEPTFVGFVITMTIARPAILTAAVAASALSFAPDLHAHSPPGIVTSQLAPKDPDPHRPTVCTEQYAPVCGRLGNTVKTYSNQCYARAAGAEVIAQGGCAGPPPPRSPQ